MALNQFNYKKLLFSVFFILIAMSVIYWNALITFGFERYLSHISKAALDGKLKYESILFQDKTWILTKPHLKSRKSIEEGGIQFQAETLAVQILPDFWNRRAAIQLDLTAPHLDVLQASSDIHKLLLNALSPASLFEIEAHLKVKEGTLHVHDADSSKKQTLYFQLDLHCTDDLQGCLVASLNDPQLQSNSLTLQLTQQEKKLFHLDGNFDKIECAPLCEVLKSLFAPLEAVEVTSGIVQGKVLLVLPKNGQPYAKGDLALQDFRFTAPSFDLKGTIQEAQIHLTENPDPRLQENKLPRTVGHFEITKGSVLEFQRDEEPLCRLEDLVGTLYFQTLEGARLNFSGRCLHQEKVSSLEIAGETRFADTGAGSLDLSLRLHAPQREDALVRFLTRELGSKFKFAEISLSNIGPAEFDLLQAALIPYFPEFPQARMTEGRIDATVLAYMKGLRIADFKIETLEAKNLQVDVDPWELNLKLGKLSGSLAVNLASPKVLESLNADLVLVEGEASFSGVNENLCHLSNMQTEFVVRRGQFLPSSIQGCLAGLKGTIDIDGNASNGEVIKLNFHGGMQGLSSMLPEKLAQALQGEFGEDALTLHAGVRNSLKGLKVEGFINVRERESQNQRIDFGFELEKTAQKMWGKWPVHHLSNAYWNELGQEVLALSTPAVGMPLTYLEGEWLKKELGIAGLVLRNGWFRSDNVLLLKYVSPLLFSDRKVTLSGFGDFHGWFDQGNMTLEYDLRGSTLEADNWAIVAPSLAAAKEGLPARHFFDLYQGISFGTLPLVNATYIDKRLGLKYTSIDTLVSSVGKVLRFDQLNTRCCDLEFVGEIQLDLTNPTPGYFASDVNIHAIQGSFSNLQRFYSHFEKLKFFQKFPFEGQLGLGERGAWLHMDFVPGDVHVASRVQGRFYGGHLLHDSSDMAIDHLAFNFDYDQSAKTFFMQDLRGTLRMGDSHSSEEYEIAAEKLSFGNCQTGEADFDIWLGDHQRDIVRIAGSTRIVEGNVLELHLDHQLTHFGDVHPENFKLTFKDWGQIEMFHVDFGLSLSTMLHDLQMLSRTGLLFLPKNLIAEVNSLRNAEGQFKVSLDYNFKTSQLTYLATADDVVADHHRYRKCLLSGKKTGSTLAIDQLLLDNISIGADLVRLSNSWKVNFLGLRLGEFLLLGLEGDYRDGDKTFDAKVNLLEANFDHAREWPALMAFVDANHPKGTLRATGQVHLASLPESKRGWHLDIVLSGALRGWELNGLRFQDTSNASFHYVTDRGLTVRNLGMGLKGSEGISQALFNIEKINFDSSKEELAVEGLNFNIPVSQINEVMQNLQKAYPAAFSNQVVSIARDLKKKDNLEGAVHFTRSLAGTNVLVKLKDGEYHFNDTLHQVHNFALSYDLKEIKVLTQYRFNDHLFWLLMKTAQPAFESGSLLFADYHPEQQQSSTGQNGLLMQWTLHPQAGFTVHSAHGNFAGLFVDLRQDPNVFPQDDAHYLVGAVHFIPAKASCLISQNLVAACKNLKIGSGYTAKGSWRFAKKELAEEGPFHFHGIVEGTNCILKGYQFQNLIAEVDFVPQRLEISHLHMTDPCGGLQIEKAYLYQEGDWKLAIPKIEISNLKPSLLQEEGAESPLGAKPLVIRQLEITNLQGHLASPESYTGKGTLQFQNSPKKNLQNTIFAIPAEILTLIGLNLTVLNPVSGTVLFDIHNGKFNITKLKDVYSEGRHSKFNLSHRSSSHVDFAGNLNVTIRMKQYNLFFKLAELFTVNIQGTLIDPKYSINNKAD